MERGGREASRLTEHTCKGEEGREREEAEAESNESEEKDTHRDTETENDRETKRREKQAKKGQLPVELRDGSGDTNRRRLAFRKTNCA